jgi:hypothetical protein
MNAGLNWESWYRALKQRDPDIYRKAIQYSEALALNYNFPMKQAAECERSHVMLACEILGVKL